MKVLSAQKRNEKKLKYFQNIIKIEKEKERKRETLEMGNNCLIKYLNTP